MPSTTRRGVLGALGAVLLTGCQGSGDESDDSPDDGRPADTADDSSHDDNSSDDAGETSDQETAHPADTLDDATLAEQFGCEAASRPTSDLEGGEEVELEDGETVELLGSLEYPPFPEDLTDDEAVRTFVEEHERAYVRNSGLAAFEEDHVGLYDQMVGTEPRDLDRRDGIVFVLTGSTGGIFFVNTEEVTRAGHADLFRVALYAIDKSGFVRQTVEDSRVRSLDDQALEDLVRPSDWELLQCRSAATGG